MTILRADRHGGSDRRDGRRIKKRGRRADHHVDFRGERGIDAGAH